MPFEQVEYKFPDEESEEKTPKEAEVEAEGSEAVVESDEIEIEVVDDTPEPDRNRKPAPPPEEVADEELAKYSEDVQKRIKKFTRGYNDERRAKEAALREKEEAVRLAQQLLEENQRLKTSVSTSQQAILENAKKAAQVELDAAKQKYKQAYESGDPDAVVDANDALTSAKLKVERLSTLKPPSLQPQQKEVQTEQVVQNPPPVDPKAQKWREKNAWFGADEEMTAFAFGLHKKLVGQGVDPTSDDYYERIDARMRQVFPEQFDSESAPEVAPKAKTKPVVAPATRSTAPKKIVLTKSQVNVAKRLGVSLEAYAKQVALEMRKQNG